MGRAFNYEVPETLTMGLRSTGSFTPVSISDTPSVSIQLIKTTDKNDVNTINLYTSNVDVQGSHGRWPSGSQNDYLWCRETGSAWTDYTNSVTAASPLLTGSAIGSVMLPLGNLNTRWVKVEILSKSGGIFKMAGAGKE